MSWSALYDETSGQLLSIASVVSDTLPAGVAVLALAGPPADSQMWDAITRAFIARPAKVLVDRLQDLLDDADFAAAWSNLNTTQRTRLRTAMIRVLGTKRYRTVSEAVEL